MIDSDSPVNKPIVHAIFSRRLILLISVGLVCLIVIGGSIWMTWQQPSAVVPPEVPLPSEVTLQESASQTEVKQAVIVDQAGVASSPVASVTSTTGTLSKHPKKIDSQKQATANVSKLPAQLTLQQQAENEFRLADQMKQQGNAAEALVGFEKTLKLDAGHEQARLEMAGMLMDKKLNNEAEQLLKEGLQLNPKQSGFALLLARLQVERNALPAALETLQLTLPYAGNQADYQSFVAALLQRQNHHKDAISYYQNALQLKPNTGIWMIGLGISLRAENRNDEAREIFKGALDTNTLNAELRSFVTMQLKAL